MQKFIKILHFLLLAILISSCSQPKAPIVNRGKMVYDRNSFKQEYKNTRSQTAKNPSNIIVSSGDTIYSIAKKYNVAIRDLISENDLTPPYNLRVGTRIKLPQNKYHLVATGDTLYSISRKYGMNVNNLIAINNLEAPYSIQAGRKLKVSNSPNLPTQDRQTSQPSAADNKSKNPPTVVNKPAPEPIPEPIIAHKNNRFAWPIKGKVISKFGAKPGGLYNDGINIKAKNGDVVKSAEDGVVAYVGDELRGYGNLIIIKHSGDWISAYAHLDKTKVKRGAKVKQGQSIATVGSTGNVKSPQLYFGLRKGREAVNPQTYL